MSPLGRSFATLDRDFLPWDEPRPLPDEPLFRLEATTLLAHGLCAHTLGNLILSFLCERQAFEAFYLSSAAGRSWQTVRCGPDVCEPRPEHAIGPQVPIWEQ